MTDQPEQKGLMTDKKTGLEAIKYQRGKLEVLDQLRLPHEFAYDNVSTCEEAFDCIKAMRVRGTCGNLLPSIFKSLNSKQEPRQLQSWRPSH